MKYKALILALICIGIACQAQNKIDKQGRRQGHWIKTDKDGSRIFEGDFVDGKETGTFLYYYPNGTLKIRNTFTEPGRYCKHEAFDSTGRLLATGYYNQHNRDSVWKFYNEEGRVIKIAGYKMGIKHGTHIVFTSTGDTAEISNWKDNHRHGRWWKRIGEKGWITAKYENGLMQGRLQEYDDKGSLIREGFYKDGLKNGKYRYFKNGVPVIDESWSKGALADRNILIHAPQDKWISVFGIAYYMSKGANGCLVYMNDGSKITCREDIETLNTLVGEELFVLIDKRNRIMAATNNITGITKDPEGRDIIQLDPAPPFTVFPDEECVKMIQSLLRSNELDQ